MANVVSSIASSGTKASVITTSTPVVTRVVRGEISINNITGMSIDYETIQDNYVLSYDATSNTFQGTPAVEELDGGEFNNGTF